MGSVTKIAEKMAKKQAIKRIHAMAHEMAATIPNQATLDDILWREPNDERRKQMFEFLKPALRFPFAKCPEMPKRIIEC